MSARKTARRSTCPTVERQHNLASIFGTQRPHVCRRQKWGSSQAEGGDTVRFPLIEKLYHQYGHRPKAKGGVVDTTWAVIAPGQAKAPPTPTDIKISHCTYGHTHDVLLKNMVEQQGVTLSGELHECRGCSMAKGLRKNTARSTHTIQDQKLQRTFVDLSGTMAVLSIGMKWYILMVRDDCTRPTRLYFLGKKSDAASSQCVRIVS